MTQLTPPHALPSAADGSYSAKGHSAGEVCPVWPGQPMTAHWGMPDPAAIDGSDEVKARAFRDAAVTLKRRIELLTALPMAALDRLAIQTQVRDIGQG